MVWDVVTSTHFNNTSRGAMKKQVSLCILCVKLLNQNEPHPVIKGKLAFQITIFSIQCFMFP